MMKLVSVAFRGDQGQRIWNWNFLFKIERVILDRMRRVMRTIKNNDSIFLKFSFELQYLGRGFWFVVSGCSQIQRSSFIKIIQIKYRQVSYQTEHSKYLLFNNLFLQDNWNCIRFKSQYLCTLLVIIIALQIAVQKLQIFGIFSPMNSNSLDSDHNDSEQQQTLKEHQQKPQESTAIIFGDNSIPMKCPFCLQHIKSEIIAKPQLVSVVLGLFLFTILPHAFTIIIVILVIQLTATQKHRCPLCERELGSNGKFLKIFKDEIYSLSFHDNGILISKKIICSGIIFIGTLFVLFIRAKYFPDLPEFTEITWPQLKQICPENTLSLGCKNQVQGKTVKNWSGYVMKVKDQRQNFRKYYEHAVRLYVKMDPSQNSVQFPDLVLTANSGFAYHYTQVLDDLSHGDEIKFNGTFVFSKTESNVDETRHMHLVGLQKTEKHDPSIHLYLTDEDKQLTERKSDKSLRINVDEEQQKNQADGTMKGGQQSK